VILEEGRVIATAEIGQLGTVLRVAAPGVAGQARAGQFVHVRPGPSFDPLLRRPYSFNRIDRAAGEIELIVKALGAGGDWIAARREGDQLDLLGPLGSSFVIQRSTRNLLLVAGGTGVAPMRVLAEQESGRRNVTLLMGGRSVAHLWPSDRLPATVEYVTTTEDGSFGIEGRFWSGPIRCARAARGRCSPRSGASAMTRSARRGPMRGEPRYSTLKSR